MTSSRIIAACLAWVALPAAWSQQSHSLTGPELAAVLHGRPMALDDALKIAMLSSRPLEAALANLDRARGMVGEAKSAFLPQIGVGGAATQFSKANVIDLGALMGGPSLPLTIANEWNPSLFAGVTLQIDLSGAIHSASSQSEFMALAARIDVDRVRNQLELDVRTAFLQALRAHDHIRVAEDQLGAANVRLRDAQENEKVGNSPRFDVISARRDATAAEAGLVAARAQESITLANLKAAVGIDQGAPVALNDRGAIISPREATTTRTKPDRAGLVTDQIVYGPEYKALVAAAMKYRPEIQESAAQVSAYKQGFRYALRSLLPSLTAGLGYTYQPNNGAFTLPSVASASLTLNVPVFDGGLAKSRLREAKADVATAESNYRAAVDGVELELQNAYVNLLQARERLRLSEAGLVEAREADRIARERYSVGVTQSSVVSPQLELSSAQAALTQAESDRVNALIDYNLALAAIDHATGRFARKDVTNGL